jgi:hypothetical protein
MTADAVAVGTGFAEALAQKDFDTLAGLFADDVDFRALTPRKYWEMATPKEIIADAISVWFNETDDVEALLAVNVRPVAGPRSLLSYQLRVRTPDGPHLVEQQAYFEHSGGRITWMRVLCAGYIRV